MPFGVTAHKLWSGLFLELGKFFFGENPMAVKPTTDIRLADLSVDLAASSRILESTCHHLKDAVEDGELEVATRPVLKILDTKVRQALARLTVAKLELENILSRMQNEQN